MSEARFSAQSGTEYPRYSNDYSADSKYRLRSFTYPENLFSNKQEFGNTWVMININVLEQSKYFKEDQSVELSPEEQGKRWTEADARDKTVGGSVVSGTVSGAAIGGVAGFLANKSGKTLLQAIKDPKVAISAAQGAAVGALTTALPVALAGTAKRSTKRLASAIQLPMPNNLMAPYSVSWDPDATKVFDLMMRIPTGFNAKDLAAQTALSMNSAAGSGGVSAATGMAANPKKEMIFGGVDFRNFTMDYVFYPKSMGETLYIKNIIELLKFHMYPEYMSKDRFTFIYPSEFDITFFMGDGIENPWVNRIATSVLTNMNVNYTPQGVWAVHEDGSPVMIQLSLTFKELSIITKENLGNPADENVQVKANY